MAYSSFLNSNWYIFWAISDAKTKEEEVLAVWYANDETLPHFTYRELKGITLPKLKKLLALDIPDKEYEEALKTIKIWLKEVDKEYRKEGGL